MSKGKNAALWVVTVLLVLAYLFSGGTKLASEQHVLINFARWGYPSWFHFVIGTVEVICGLLLLMPRVAWIGAGVLMLNMCGAIVTRLRSPDSADLKGLPLDLILLVLLAGVFAVRRRQQRA